MNINAKFSDLHVLSYNKSALNNDTLRSIKAVGSLEFIALEYLYFCWQAT